MTNTTKLIASLVVLVFTGSYLMPAFACKADQPAAHQKVIDAAVHAAISEKNSGVEKTRSEKISTLVYAKVIPLVKTNEKKKSSPDEMFSRCPSGYRYSVATGENAKTPEATDYNIAYGKITYRAGCSKSTDVCDFKIDLATSTVWLKDKDAKEYMTTDAWVSARKRAPATAG